MIGNAFGAIEVVEASVTLNYTTVLNALFLALSAALVFRFLRTGGPAMLRAMSGPAGGTGAHDDHGEHPEHAEHRAGREGITHVCPMHPEVCGDTPGRCPVCGMRLVRSDAGTLGGER